MKTVRLKPSRPGLIVRKPVPPHVPLAASGEDVVLDAHWRRRRRDGDVVHVEPSRKKGDA